MQLQWWYWIIAGFFLIGLELIFPSFTIIWFGLGALAVGVLKLLWRDLPPAAQILFWSVSSISFTAMWFKYLKPKNNRTHADISEEGIVGETGIIVRGTDDSYGRGIVRFRIPVLGTDEWSCYSEDVLQLGDTVRVTDIDGQILKVDRVLDRSN